MFSSDTKFVLGYYKNEFAECETLKYFFVLPIYFASNNYGFWQVNFLIIKNYGRLIKMFAPIKTPSKNYHTSKWWYDQNLTLGSTKMSNFVEWLDHLTFCNG